MQYDVSSLVAIDVVDWTGLGLQAARRAGSSATRGGGVSLARSQNSMMQ